MTSEPPPREPRVPAYRFGVTSAVAWRIVAELLRRHHHRESFRLVHLHPGLSPTGMLQLCSRVGEDDAASVAFLLGSEPRVVIHRPFVPAAASALDWGHEDHVSRWLESADPKFVVDDIQAALGFPVAKTPSATPRVLTYRVLAALLERKALAREQVRASSGWYDTSALGAQIAEWARALPWLAGETARLDANDWVSQAVVAGEVWAVHGWTEHPVPLAEALPNGSVILDAKRGHACLPNRGSDTELMPLYQKAGRRLGPVVRHVETMMEGG
ncbi:MAG: hypothetical protein H6719_32770 [Sandaracinaceae bacterium]|nr:hypothetical protein [Sandaracinaceae bacterium]